MHVGQVNRTRVDRSAIGCGRGSSILESLPSLHRPLAPKTLLLRIVFDTAHPDIKMASLRRESGSMSTQRRDSLTHARTRSRPRLLRSSATEPSITATSAVKGSLVSPSPPRTATDILHRVAVYPPTYLRSAHLDVESASHTDPIPIMRDGAEQPMDVQSAMMMDSPSSGRTFHLDRPANDNVSPANKSR